jgi:putative DNA methylase
VTTPHHKKKLIEVALPLDEINAACKADKDRRIGTIRNIHKWFAPMPLPAWRALLFAALVDDPADDEKRAYLLDVIKRLVANGADLPDDDTLEEAQKIIATQFAGDVPTVMDPFCGGGSTLVEAQRLGLPTFGSDLNPVPVLITRTITQLLPQVYGQQPLHPQETSSKPTGIGSKREGSVRDDEAMALFPKSSTVKTYTGYEGLACDVTYYALQVREKAWKRLSPYYPIMHGERPIAWIWARTVRCPNPTCGIETLLITSFWLSKKKGDLAWIEPHVENGDLRLDVVSGQREGEPPASPKVGRGGSFTCLRCGQVMTEEWIASEGLHGRMGYRMTSVAAVKNGRRIFRCPTEDEIEAARAVPEVPDPPTLALPDNPRWFSGPRFGLTTQADLYTPRQLSALMTFTELVADTHAEVMTDGGTRQWANAIVSMLGLAIGRLAASNSSQARITVQNNGTTTRFNAAFARNDLPMTWDFPEMEILGSEGVWLGSLPTVLDALSYVPRGVGVALRADARSVVSPKPALVAADPPYFDSIGYADLSDYFYIWHRRALRDVYPDLYTTVAAPKTGELTAVPSHHGNNMNTARMYFIDGFTETFGNLQRSLAPGLPMLIVYASKEQSGGTQETTRWSSILSAIIAADLEITGTWPIHGTRSARLIGIGTNAVATYVAMVCRPRPENAETCSLSDFNRALRRELRPAVHGFQAAGILPVDLAQAAMGPGMQVYSRYRQVVDQSGNRVSVEQALRLINSALGEVLDEQEGELDPYSRFAVAWWEKHGWSAAAFGEADQLARPQGISVDDVVRADVAHYPRPGFVSLLGSGELNRNWKPSTDRLPTAWEAVHHLADRLISGGGELEAGELMRELGTLRDPAQALVYRLHDIAAKRGRTKDQERYNSLIGSWSDLLAVAASTRGGLF